jgi:hypothetical protein
MDNSKIRKSSTLRQSREALELRRNEYETKQYEVATRELGLVLEARNIVVDEDLERGWMLVGQAGERPTETEHETVQASAYKLYHENLFARSIVRNLAKFVLGKGPTIIPDDANPEVKKTWQEFRKLNKMNQREKEIVSRTFRDGEVFLRKFVDETDGTVKIRFIRASLISDPSGGMDDGKSFGIETDPDDIETPVVYYKQKVDRKGQSLGRGEFEAIPADEIIHIKVFCDADQKRGVTIYRVCAKRLKQYEEWLLDRIVLNKIRTAITLVKKVDAPAGTVKSIREEGLSTRMPESYKRQKMLERGTVITASKGISYEMLSPNINASDVAEDGRSMLLSIATGVGFPEMLLTSSYENANFASTMVAQNPWVREVEDWQDFFTSFYQELFELVIQTKIDAGMLPSDTETTCAVEFPPMIAANLKEMAEAYEIQQKYRIMSKRTWRAKMGLDNDQEKLYIEEEDAEEGNIPSKLGVPPVPGPVPGQIPQQGAGFNMPKAPVNQYGSMPEEDE